MFLFENNRLRNILICRQIRCCVSRDTHIVKEIFVDDTLFIARRAEEYYWS
jgi:hypothetical protein